MTQTIRARDLGIPFLGEPGAFNAITDVAGVEVGHTTLIQGEGELRVGQGPVRTGVTVVLPRGKRYDPCFAAWHSLNGNGEMTGTTWIEESGFLEGPIAITNSHSVGVVRDALVQWHHQNALYDAIAPGTFWLLPVVAETYDGVLNDINGMHVKAEHLFAAIDQASSGQIAEGCVGGGTGMNCYGFKAGSGTASRRVEVAGERYTVGVLVQANHGDREELMIAGVPVGRELADIPGVFDAIAIPPGAGSIIVVVATDAPLLPHQLKRLARRVPMGLSRTGTVGGHYSGDIFLAFSTANSSAARRQGLQEIKMLANDELDPFFAAVAYAVEEAVINALVAARTMTGINGRTMHAIPHERLLKILKQHHGTTLKG